MNKEARRDLELIMFGMALHNETRKEMLSEVNPVLLSAEFTDLFESVSGTKAPAIVKDWLAARGAPLEKDRTVKQTIIAAIHKSNAESKLRLQVKTVERAMKVGTSKQMVDALQTALDSAKELQEIESA